MLETLARLFLAAVVLLVPATLLIFVGGASRPRAGRLSWWQGLLAAALTAAAAAAVATGFGFVHPQVVALALGVGVLVWWPVARDWDVRGLVAWALAVNGGLAYLLYVLVWTASAHSAATIVASGLLWLLEVFMFLIGAGYVWELVDVLARRHWTDAPVPDGSARPFVSLHVPTHNEPPELVIETLEQMLLLDYDDFEILLVDNNTTDPALWRPLAEFCARHDRITFIHLEDWPGYKSGALNYALTRTDPRAEVIGIVDADYHVAADWLTRCAPLFSDPEVAFVQTPQDYRDWSSSAYFRRLYHSYGYFFEVSQRSRAERNGAIFGGTMGLIRREALADAGGWDEWCITEDAELSLRLLKAGGRGIHISEPFGRGVMPLTFESLKGQRFRWCFGGIQILRLHWRSMLPGRRTSSNQLTLGQRWAYLVGALQWFGDLASLLFAAFLVVGAVGVLVDGSVVVRRMSAYLLLGVVALVVLGGVRSVALVRRTSGASWRDAFGAFGLWLALGLTVARASWLGLVSRHGTFLRTPKVKGEPRAIDALRGNRLETCLAIACGVLGLVVLVAAPAAGALVGVMLLVQSVGHGLAPVNSIAAMRSELTAEQRRLRGWVGSWASNRPARRGAALLAGLGAGLAAFLLLAAPVGVGTLPDVGSSVRTIVQPSESAAPTLTSEPSPVAATVSSATSSTLSGTASAGASPATTSTSARPVRHPSPTAVASAAPTRSSGPTAVATSAAPTTAAARPTQAASLTAKPTSAPTQAVSPTSKPTSAPTQAASPTSRPTTVPTGGRPTTTP